MNNDYQTSPSPFGSAADALIRGMALIPSHSDIDIEARLEEHLANCLILGSPGKQQDQEARQDAHDAIARFRERHKSFEVDLPFVFLLSTSLCANPALLSLDDFLAACVTLLKHAPFCLGIREAQAEAEHSRQLREAITLSLASVITPPGQP